MVIPHLLKSRSPHILNLAPPLNLNPIWFKNHTGNRGNRAGVHRQATLAISYDMPILFLFLVFDFSQHTQWRSTACPCASWECQKSSEDKLPSMPCGLALVGDLKTGMSKLFEWRGHGALTFWTEGPRTLVWVTHLIGGKNSILRNPLLMSIEKKQKHS